jgi:hypothetical protein
LRAALLLLRKDLRLLVRSPGQVLVLVGYPLVVAVLIAVTLQSDGRDYSIALVNLDDSGRTVRVGDERLSVDDYVRRLEDRVDVERLGPEEAEKALEDGRVTAVVTIPEGFVSDLQSGIRQPTVRLETSRRTPVEAEAIEREMEAAVFRFNQGLAADYVGQVLGLVDLVLNGGEIRIFGVDGEALGLARAERLITGIQDELVAREQSGLAGQLAPILTFIDQTQANLSLARPAANAISSPIELEIVGDDSGRRALSALGVAAALVVSLGLVGSLLGAAGIASEREESTLARLRRGLASPWAIVGAKVAFAGAACVLVGLLLLAGTSLLGGLAVGRWRPSWSRSRWWSSGSSRKAAPRSPPGSSRSHPRARRSRPSWRSPPSRPRSASTCCTPGCSAWCWWPQPGSCCDCATRSDRSASRPARRPLDSAPCPRIPNGPERPGSRCSRRAPSRASPRTSA